MKMAGVATASASCEPWVFRGSKKPTLHTNIAVSVATKAPIFIRVIEAPLGEPCNMKMTSTREPPRFS